MQLIVFSPPHFNNPRECHIVNTLLKDGPAIFHLRKPQAHAFQLESYIENIHPEHRSRVVLHQHHDLATRYHLKGIHYPEKVRPPPPLPRTTHSQSTSFHDPVNLQEDWGGLDYAFLSPIFDSISKEGYLSAGFDPVQLQTTLATCRIPVFALGGITCERISEAKDMGFSGVAVLGTVWQAEDPIAAYHDLLTVVQDSS